jgi:trans-2,3-dihydro-3-hydroxyanthranilate isomerase
VERADDQGLRTNGQLGTSLTLVTGALWADAPETDDRRSYLIAGVFTGTPLEGNQLGVFLDARGMTTDLMQRTARELNLSETVFFLPADDSANDVRVRIFTPVSELPFAGHPTLGSGFVLAERLGKKNITLETGLGPIPLEFQDDGYGQMEQRIPEAELYEDTESLLEALHLKGSELPVEAYRNGPRHVYVALPDLAAVASLKPDLTQLKEHAVGINCFAGQGTSWKTRVFVPSLGVGEDPATGSAAGPLGIHLRRHGRIGFGQRIEVSQGEEINRPSTLYIQVDGSEDTIEHVYVGGYAVIVASGQYRLG